MLPREDARYFGVFANDDFVPGLEYLGIGRIVVKDGGCLAVKPFGNNELSSVEGGAVGWVGQDAERVVALCLHAGRNGGALCRRQPYLAACFTWNPSSGTPFGPPWQ